MKDNQKTVLVVGGAGYIGAHACKAIAAAGMLPVVYDNLVHGHEEFVQWGPFEQGDILDSDRLDAVFRKHKPDAVMHFAAYAYVGESVEKPDIYYRNNVCGTVNLLDAMLRADVRTIVFSSTCATYGIPDAVPITEETAQVPINPYGASKLMIERILTDYGTAFELDWVALRYFNAAGADPDGEIGEWHVPETHLIPLVLEAASGHRTHVTIFGDDYDTLDGTCVRDYIHVSDLADAHVKALEYLAQGGQSDAFNLGNGIGFSVQEVVEAVEEVTDCKVRITIGPRRPGDPARLISDTRRAREELQWQPQYSDLNGIVSSAWKWHQRDKPCN
ncbi:UDP-glucose 4-epimerase GalE [Parasphingorhabdus sp.]|uniref:UDP-glucose 4-epimerase GalE n=1 Tax=Parasphingorhabdus sp. TaxID=2709688 RepID=UPI003A924D3A